MSKQRKTPLPISEDGPLCTALVGNSADLFREIMAMYAPEGAMCLDMNWGTGRFWKRIDPSFYQVVGIDTSEKLRSTTCAHWLVRGDNTALPFRNNSFDVCVLDPAFGTGSSTAQTIGTAESYNLAPLGSMNALYDLYSDGSVQAWRVLKRAGLLIVKAQDVVMSGRFQPVHYIVKMYTELIGFKLIMTYILVRKGKPIMRHTFQRNPRASHSYFQVFRKEG